MFDGGDNGKKRKATSAPIITGYENGNESKKVVPAKISAPEKAGKIEKPTDKKVAQAPPIITGYENTELSGNRIFKVPPKKNQKEKASSAAKAKAAEEQLPAILVAEERPLLGFAPENVPQLKNVEATDETEQPAKLTESGETKPLSAKEREKARLTEQLEALEKRLLNPEKDESKPVKPRWKRIVNGVLTGLLIFVLAVVTLFAGYAIFERFSGDGTVFVGKYALLKIVSDSMEPTLKVGDVIIIEKVKISDLSAGTEGEKDGDIITYTQNGVIITHRVERLNGDGTVKTRGDHNSAHEDDYSVTESMIEGRVVYYSHTLGIIHSFVTSIAGLFLLIITPVGIVMITETVSLTKKLAKLKRENEIKAALKKIDSDN